MVIAAQTAQQAAVDLLDRLSHIPLNAQEAERLRALLDSRMRYPSPNPMRSGFLDTDGLLRMPRWAIASPVLGFQRLAVPTGERPTPMRHTDATGQGLVTNGHLGVDVIRVAAGQGFIPHTHPGDHLLIVVAGKGTVTFEGRIYPTMPGTVYMIEGAVPHGVGAIDDHVILAVGAPHKAVDSVERMTPVEYESVLAPLTGTLECLLCHLRADPAGPNLRDQGCTHDPWLQYRD